MPPIVYDKANSIIRHFVTKGWQIISHYQKLRELHEEFYVSFAKIICLALGSVHKDFGGRGRGAGKTWLGIVIHAAENLGSDQGCLNQ